MNARRTCRKCSRRLEIPPTGRPPTYCGPACRRAAEYELRRIAHRLEGLESDRHRRRLALIDLRGAEDTGPDEMEEAELEPSQAIAVRQLAEVDREIGRCERRLLALMADEPEPPMS